MRLIINVGGPDLTKRYFRETPGKRRTHIPGRCRGSYTEGKASFIWEITVRAHRWHQRIGWQPGPSDA